MGFGLYQGVAALVLDEVGGRVKVTLGEVFGLRSTVRKAGIESRFGLG